MPKINSMFPDYSPQQQTQYHELARLKTIKQACLILGIIFSIIGLISMCDHPVPTNKADVAQQLSQSQPDSKAIMVRSAI